MIKTCQPSGIRSQKRTGSKIYRCIGISMYQEVINVSWLVVVGDVNHGVPTRDVVRMRDRTPSDR